MILITITLACCVAWTARADATRPDSETVAAYAQVVAAVRAEQTDSASKTIFLADTRIADEDEGFGHPHGATGKHPEKFLRELVACRIVDGMYVREQRSESYPCSDCTRVVLGSLLELKEPILLNPKNPSVAPGPDGVPVRYSVDAIVAWPCSARSVREGWCSGGDQNSRRYFFSRQPDGALHLETYVVTGAP